MTAFVIAWCFLVGEAREPGAATPAAMSAVPLYDRHATLQDTLLATRRRYSVWLAEQAGLRRAATLGQWHAAPSLSEDALDREIRPETVIDLSAKSGSGGPLWTPLPLADGRLVKLVDGAGKPPAYLARAIRADRAGRLTVGIGGGRQLDVWLNGSKVASAETALPFGRYGCSEGFEGTRVDQVLVELDLKPGENILLLRVVAGSEPSFYVSSAPDPIPAVWKQLRHDFPEAQNPLLALVPAEWFETTGWFSATATRLEEQLIDRLAAECGEDGPAILAELGRLRGSSPPAGHDDRHWLDLCVKCSVLATLRGELFRLRAAVEALGRSHPEHYPARELLTRLDAFAKRVTGLAAGPVDPADARGLLAELPPLRREMLVDRNPMLRGREIVFVKRPTYNSKHFYDDFQHISAWGGNLCVLSLADGRVRELAPQLTGGIFDRYDLSFDARRIAFGYRRPVPEGYRIYEIGVDGGGLRQVTHPPADEDRRIATYGRTSYGDGFYGLLGYQFWTDDVHPCYLPDGGLCFASTRSEHGVLCTPAHYLACTNLYRIDAGGGRMRPLSHGALSEFTPTMMEDGRILYNRWEYVYKGIAAVQPLWTMRPDGSGGEEFYGDNIANPGVFWQARQVPGNPRMAVCIGCGHEPLGVGQVLLLDLTKNKRTPEPIANLTPEVRIQNLRGILHLRNGAWREDYYGPLYCDPYPLSDKFFLVSCNPDRRYNDPAGYGLYLLDVFGNRVPIYHDPAFSSWQPMLLLPRTPPPSLPPVRSEPEQPETATLFLSDVYRGLDGVPRGTVKYLRVMEQAPKPWSAEVDPLRGEDRGADGFGGHLAVSWNAHIWIAVLHGVVPVEEDGSACFKVPAGRNLFFQALDKDFMEVQRMRTFINLEPGENRSCVGCHEHRTQAPSMRLASAARRPPAALGPQPGETAPRPLYYPTDIQPILDRHCVRCHDGKDPKASPDLRGELTALFSRSYEAIMQGKWVNTIQEWNGGDYAMMHAAAVPSYTYGSHRSRLVDLLRKGHHEVTLDRDEHIRLVTWIDCGGPYYGSYFGRRSLDYRGQADFRPVPTVASACGTPPVYPALAPPEPLPSRLLAWWRLDEAAPRPAIDASGQHRDAQSVGLVRTEGRDKRGAQRFDGRGYLACGDLGAHEAVSIALWVKADSLAHTWNPLMFCDDGQPGAVHFSLLADGTPNVAINTGDWNWTHRKAREPLVCGQWRHLVLVCDGRLNGNVRFYLDGKPAGESRLGLGRRLDLYRFRLGAWNRWEREPANNFHGELTDVRIYSGTLGEVEIAALASGKQP